MRKRPVRHTVKQHKRKGKTIKSYTRGHGTSSTKAKQSKSHFRKYTYPLDESLTQKLRSDEKLVWMSPREFLSHVPHPALEGYPATFDLNPKWFSASSITYLTKAIKKGKLQEPLFLDYERPFRGFPTHEGRHRAYVAIQLGIAKIPVIVRGKK